MQWSNYHIYTSLAITIVSLFVIEFAKGEGIDLKMNSNSHEFNISEEYISFINKLGDDPSKFVRYLQTVKDATKRLLADFLLKDFIYWQR